jgi:hypothetical protein
MIHLFPNINFIDYLKHIPKTNFNNFCAFAPLREIVARKGAKPQSFMLVI